MTKVFVLDDDPTGTQAVHGVPVLAVWDGDALVREFETDYPAAFILTNTRALTQSHAVQRIQEIGANLRAASLQTGKPFRAVSRSDSTLRGHFPAEVLALKNALGLSEAPILLCPFFAAGGRVTVDDVHYLCEGEERVPVGETEFARDRTFGYRSSNLRDWVREKSGDTLHTESISLKEVRSGRATDRLINLPNDSVCVLNCETNDDLSLLVAGVKEAESAGRQFVFRTAASFAAAYAGVKGKKWQPRAEHMGVGLVVVGSYVQKSTEQLQVLHHLEGLAPILVDITALLDGQREGEIIRCSTRATEQMQQGKTPVLFTSREHRQAGDLSTGARISDALVSIVESIEVAPHWMVAKGGITSNDIATKALGIRRALVLGQIAAGVAVWECGEETKWPKVPYVVFPGNVGATDTLTRVVQEFM